MDLRLINSINMALKRESHKAYVHCVLTIGNPKIRRTNVLNTIGNGVLVLVIIVIKLFSSILLIVRVKPRKYMLNPHNQKSKLPSTIKLPSGLLLEVYQGLHYTKSE